MAKLTQIQKGFLKGFEIYSESENAHELPWLVLFHGYGADASDLFGLYDYLTKNCEFNFFCPQGPLEVPIGPGWTGRAWWNIDMEEIQRLMMLGKERDFAGEKPEGLQRLRAKIIQSLEKIAPWRKIVLGGFSQGAMLATDIYLHAPEPPAGLCVLSGTLVNQEEWGSLFEKRRGEEIFQSHGQSDSVLKINGAERLKNCFSQAGLKVNYNSFPGGHEIPPRVIQQLNLYLDKKMK